MAGLFSSGEQDMLGNIVQQRQQANQALGSGYGKYGGIVQAAGGLIDTGTDAMFGGKVGASDPRMQQMEGAKAIFAKVSKEMVDVTSPAFYERLAVEFSVGNFPEQAEKAKTKAEELKKAAFDMQPKPGTAPELVRLQAARDALPVNDPRRVEIQAQIDKIGAPSKSASEVNIDMGKVFQEAYNKADAKKAAEAWDEEGAKYKTNANTLVRLKELRPELSKAYTGQFGEAKLVVAKSLQALGLPVDMEAITTTEQLKAATSQFVQAIAKTFPGSQSNKELDQLIASTPNILQIMPTIIKKMTEIERELVAQQATYRQMDNMPVAERAKSNGNRLYVDNLKSTRRYYALMDKQTSEKGVSKAEIAEAIKLQQELGVD